MAVSNDHCQFCSLLGQELYTCPRCKARFCSIRCYRSTRHQQCSEDFYRDCVHEKLRGMKWSDEKSAKNVETFEEYMARHGSMGDDVTESSSRVIRKNCDRNETTSVTVDNSDENDTGFLDDTALDSDDDEEYLEEVTKKTLNEYKNIDEDQVDRNLTALGIGIEPQQLYAALNEEEQVAFTLLADQVNYDESGFDKSVFRNKRGSPN